jgi:hypothetical protein
MAAPKLDLAPGLTPNADPILPATHLAMSGSGVVFRRTARESSSPPEVRRRRSRSCSMSDDMSDSAWKQAILDKR